MVKINIIIIAYFSPYLIFFDNRKCKKIVIFAVKFKITPIIDNKI